MSGATTMASRANLATTLRSPAADLWQGAMKLHSKRALGALGLTSFGLIAAIVGSNLLVLSNLRENTLRTAETNLARYSLTLAEEADRSFKSLDLVLSSTGDYLGRREVTDSDSYQRTMSDQETHLWLKEKIVGLPHVDAVTMINEHGKLINFSRYWPIPDVNVSDRDYFKALSSDANADTFISAPVQNRGSGTWNIYVARRLNDPNGAFMGLLLGAISQQYFENFFGASSPGAGTTVSLQRADGMVLARFPNAGRQRQGKGRHRHRARARHPAAPTIRLRCTRRGGCRTIRC